MMRSTWQVDEPAVDEPAGAPPTPLASLHFLTTAVLRRWRTWVGLGAVGLLLGASAALMLSSPSKAEVTLMLAHPAGADPAQEMATDISLLRTRSVAGDVIDRLGLEMSPDELQGAVTLEQVSTTVLVVTVAAGSPEAAAELADTLATSFLDFRRTQMEMQAEALARGYGDRIEELESEIADLTDQSEEVDENGGGQAVVSDLLTRRAELATEVDALQQTVEQSTIETAALTAASHVLDPTSAVPAPGARRVVLTAMSGAIGGAAVGIGIVLFTALTSDKLRRREDVALALGVPVRFTAGGGSRLRLPGRAPGASPAHEQLGRTIAAAYADRQGGPHRLAVGATGNIEDCEAVTAALVAALARTGASVFVADLSPRGRLAASLGESFADGSSGPAVVPTVTRPEEGVLARGPGSVRRDGSSATGLDAEWRAADVVVVLVDIDPGTGIDQVPSWADQVVPVVTAGRSSAERLRTTVELVRSSGLDLPFAVMVGADGLDDSSGRLEEADQPSPIARRDAR
ncbi:hypothetical protein [Nocardioides sp. TF02-7]|uniref:hypothetical protein n=1 Tax=Nocardioides sp. TF02-7 TaxID=2917724 RepID=UPI001F061AEF|nr:hypothetical protein [Nocardioides sp. TF02-7]UMG91538.1 hypothetical protein MF408_15665 [Nocardioides sp. TF02-7]